MIARVIVRRVVEDDRNRYRWVAVDSTGRKIGASHKSFTRLANALRNIERITGCSTEILPRVKQREYRVASWGREFVIDVEDTK